MLFLVEDPIQKQRRSTRNQHTEPSPEEHQPTLTRVKVIDFAENERNGSEEGEEKAEGERAVQAEQADYGLREKHATRSQQR